ncbi:54_t:CDS:2, partial [Dentiscutata erythropus]
GYMPFEKWAVEFIDTPHFQRLRDIKQLGSTYYVFPSAAHSRFEHSLGTAHLAYTLTKRLQEQQGIEKSDHDLECVTLAALPSSGWKHEKGSEMMVEHLFKELESCSVDLGTDDEKFIKALIRGDSKGNKRSPYLFDIVSNERNSVDVDKYDYLARDCYHLGLKSLFDFSRLMQFSRVMDDQIAYYHKECFNIYEMFHTRYSLHKKVYSHRVGGAIDYMIRDALVEANSYFKIADAIESAEEYIQLSDSILNRIEYSVCEMINEREIISHQNDSLPLHEDDVIVDWQTLNYAKKDENPVDAVRFYNDGEVTFPIYRSNVSDLFPVQYEEYIVRIFARNSDKVEAIQNAFRKLAKKLGLELSQGFLKSGSRKRHFPEEDP